MRLTSRQQKGKINTIKLEKRGFINIWIMNLLAEVEDEELLDRLSQIFESRFEELYEYDEEEDSENQ